MTYALTDQLRGWSSRSGDKVALRVGTRSCTYSELEEAAEQVAALLRGRGVSAGDRVALMGANSIEFVAALYGIWGAEAIVVGINPRLSVADAHYQLEDSGARVVLADDGGASELAHQSLQGLDAEVVLLTDAVNHEHRVRLSTAEPDTDATIFYTSGTTGRPKGAVHSFRSLSTQIIAMTDIYELGEEDVLLNCLPLCLLSVLVGGPLSSIYIGATCRIVEHFDVEEICQLVAADRVTFAIVVPVFFFDAVKLADDGLQVDLSSLRVLHFGGSSIAPELRDEAELKLGVRTTQAYGATECPNMVAGEGLAPDRTINSTGRPLPFARIFIEDPDGREVPSGEVGEVAIGPNPDSPHPFVPMSRYWNREGDTLAALRGGRLHLGDLGRLDHDGRLVLVGRQADLIIRGGLNVYPSELERVLTADERVASAAVVAHAHERLGEVPAAYVTLVEGRESEPEDILRTANAELSRYKAIERLVVVDGFPRNAMGKVVKRELVPFAAAHPQHVLAQVDREGSVIKDRR